MKKYRKFGYEGLAEVYIKARKEGYSRTYDSMCKIIKKIKGNAKEKLKKQHKRKKKVEQAKYPTRYNNISRKVLGFKSPNEVLKEYKQNH